MGIISLTSMVRKTGAGICTKLKRTSSAQPEKLVQSFLETLSPQAKFSSYSQEARCAITDFVQIGNTSATSYIKTLIDNNVAERDILSLNPKLVSLKNNRKLAKEVMELYFKIPKPDIVKKIW